MIQGSAFSARLHGSLIAGVLFGLPSLPTIFDREFEGEDAALSVTVEVITEQALEQLQAVLAPQDRAEPLAPVNRKPGELAPLVLPQQSDKTADEEDRARAAAPVSTRETAKGDGKTGSTGTSIPAGELDRRKVEQTRAQRTEDASETIAPSSARLPATVTLLQTAPRPERQGDADGVLRASGKRASADGADKSGTGDTPADPSSTEASEQREQASDPERSAPVTESASAPKPGAGSADTATAQIPASARQATATARERTRPAAKAPDAPANGSRSADTRRAPDSPANAQTATETRQVIDERTERQFSETAVLALPSPQERPPEANRRRPAAGENALQNAADSARTAQRNPAGSARTEGEQSAAPAQNRVERIDPARGRDAPSPKGAQPAEPRAEEAPPIEENPFLAAFSGPEREVVQNLISADRRLRESITPRKADLNIPAQARSRTLRRLQEAAEEGFAHAQYNLAGKFLRGEDVPRDIEQARVWISKASEQGYAPAQLLLGLMNYTGVGLPRDLAETAFWWSLAAQRGHAAAKLGTELIQPTLKPSEVVKARRLKARWGRLITDIVDEATGNSNLRDLNENLRTAAEEGETGAVLSMLARGADADAAGKDGRNAVMNAAWRGRAQIVRLLLQRGATTEFMDNDGRTPLIWAAINGHSTVAADLIASGANPNHIDRNGSTALMRAAWNGHENLVRQLIDADAETNLVDLNGQSALSYARKEGHTGIVRALRAAGAR